MLNYKQLYYFWNAATHGGITRAAEQLHLTPQTISGQIHELEASLDTKLFRKHGRQLKLTKAGELAFSHAEEIFQVGKELEGLIKGHIEEGDQPFRVGISDVIPKSIAYRLLAPATELEVPVQLFCYESKLELLFAELAIHKIDMVIADRPIPSDLGVKGFNHFLGDSSAAFFATPELLASHTRPFPDILDKAPVILPGSESAMRRELERWFNKLDIQPYIKGEFDDSALMKAFGEQGYGIFPAPNVIADEVEAQHGVKKIGCADEINCQYYAISTERKLRHPAVIAISESAQNELFV